VFWFSVRVFAMRCVVKSKAKPPICIQARAYLDVLALLLAGLARLDVLVLLARAAEHAQLHRCAGAVFAVLQQCVSACSSSSGLRSRKEVRHTRCCAARVLLPLRCGVYVCSQQFYFIAEVAPGAGRKRSVICRCFLV
jgi:hypothetical protein